MSTSSKHNLFLALSLPDNLVKYLESNNCHVTIAKTVPCSREELLNSISSAHAIFCTPAVNLDKEFFDRAPNLKVYLFFYS